MATGLVSLKLSYYSDALFNVEFLYGAIQPSDTALRIGFGIMRSPCEEVVWEILPGIRATIAQELVKRGVSQRDISKLMNITPAAVSQYVSGKRGYSIVFRDDIRYEISRLAEDLMNGGVEDLTERICEICKRARGQELCPLERSEEGN